MLMKTEVKINLISIAIFIIAIFLVGYFSHKSGVYKKEIKAVKGQIAIHDRVKDSLSGRVAEVEDSIILLKGIIDGNKSVIAQREREKASLKKELLAVKENAGKLPTSEKYNALITSMKDSVPISPRTFPFSSPEVDFMYIGIQQLAIAKETILVCESYSDMLAYNLSLSEELIGAQGMALSIMDDKEKEYLAISDLKDQQIKILKKEKRSGRTLTYMFGISAAILGVIAVIK